MSNLSIITDHKWKQFKFGDEVPDKILQDDFDWLNENDNFDKFILYRKRWYHLSDFMIISENTPFDKQWQGYEPDSAFSGILIQVSNDCEEYKIATYIS